MPPKIYQSYEEKKAANAKRMARKRAEEKTGNPNSTPKRQKFSKYVSIFVLQLKNSRKFEYVCVCIL